MPEPTTSPGGDDQRTKTVRWIVWLFILGLTVWFFADLLISA